MTTAKDAKHAKVKTTATTHLNRDPSLNLATNSDSKSGTAINEDAAKPKPNASIVCPAKGFGAGIILHPTNVDGHPAVS